MTQRPVAICCGLTIRDVADLPRMRPASAGFFIRRDFLAGNMRAGMSYDSGAAIKCQGTYGSALLLNRE